MRAVRSDAGERPPPSALALLLFTRWMPEGVRRMLHALTNKSARPVWGWRRNTNSCDCSAFASVQLRWCAKSPPRCPTTRACTGDTRI